MARRRIRNLPVLDSGMLVGVLSERDILNYRANLAADEAWWLAPVSAAMRTAPPTAAPDDEVSRVADRLMTSQDSSLPIVDHGMLVGVVTGTDLLDSELRASPPPAPQTPATAADVMTEFPLTVSPTHTLVEAAEVMVENQVRHLPVVENGRVVGMLSDRDIRDLVGDPVRFVGSRDPKVTALSVRDAMTADPATVTSDRPVLEVAERLADQKIGAVPVVDDAGRPLGIVSYIDVLRALAA